MVERGGGFNGWSPISFIFMIIITVIIVPVTTIISDRSKKRE